MKTSESLSRAAITLAAVGMSTAANAHDSRNHDARNHDRTIFSHQVAQKCNRIVAAPAPQVVIYPTTTYAPPVTTMVPTTTLEDVTTCTVTQQPVTTYVPSTNTGYYSSTPTYTEPSYTGSNGQCNIEGTGEVVPCPTASDYNTGATHAPHTSGTYTGQSYPGGTITGGVSYPSGSITEGYTTPTYSNYAPYSGQTYNNGTTGYYTPSTSEDLLAGASPLTTGGSILDYTRSQNGVSNGVNSILGQGSQGYNIQQRAIMRGVHVGSNSSLRVNATNIR